MTDKQREKEREKDQKTRSRSRSPAKTKDRERSRSPPVDHHDNTGKEYTETLSTRLVLPETGAKLDAWYKASSRFKMTQLDVFLVQGRQNCEQLVEIATETFTSRKHHDQKIRCLLTQEQIMKRMEETLNSGSFTELYMRAGELRTGCSTGYRPPEMQNLPADMIQCVFWTIDAMERPSAPKTAAAATAPKAAASIHGLIPAVLAAAQKEIDGPELIPRKSGADKPKEANVLD